MWALPLAVLGTIPAMGREAPSSLANPGQVNPADPGDRPNIILIMADDLGIDAVHCTGGPFKTPNIDRLAAEGTLFERCYSAPLCGPSRCQILTGRYPFRTGLISNDCAQAIQPSTEVMIPTVMKKAGYATACAGKWGQMSFGPVEWGFDESIVFNNGQGGRYWLDKGGGTYQLNGKPVKAPGKYFPDLTHDFVVDFISRNKNAPFFIYYPMPHVHSPILPTPDSAKGADGKQLYADNIEYMDKLVGRLMEELKRQNLDKKTLVLFTGDNGTAHFGVNAGSMLNGRPVSGQKGTMLEGGSRVPLIARWPGTTPAEKRVGDLVDFSDFLGTFAELGGAPLPKGVVLDSHSFAPQIKGRKGSPRDWIYVELKGKSYVRDNRFKLTNSGDLFDLAEAPFVEKPVPRDTTDKEALAARVKLQKVLDDHPTASSSGPSKEKAEKKQKKKKRRAARNAPVAATG